MTLSEPVSRYPTVGVRVLAWLGIGAALGVAMLIRYYLIEPATVAQACDAGMQGWTCGIRRLAILCFDHQQLGYIALTGCVLALLMRSSWIAWLSAVVSVTGLVWYCFEPCAVGLVISVLVLARTQVRKPYRDTEPQT
jgi:hypothetical protein